MFNMLLVLSITFHFHYNIWGCMCSSGPCQYRWWWLEGYIYSWCYYHHQIGSIHLSHCYHIIPWLCAWDVCYIIFCHLLHIRSGKTGNLFALLWRHWTYKMPVRYTYSYINIHTQTHTYTYIYHIHQMNACLPLEAQYSSVFSTKYVNAS